MMRRHITYRRAVYLVLALVAVLVYANGLRNGFVYDDHNLIERNEAIRGWKSTLSGMTLYRPARWITYAIEYQIWGLNPFGYHLTNVLLHVACTLLVFAFARRILASDFAAALASLIFAVHPAHAEAVANIANRPDLLATFFILAAALCYAMRRRSAWLYMLSLVSFALGLLSKESVAMAFPLFVVAYDLYFDRTGALRRFLVKHAKLHAPFFALLAANLVLGSYNRMISERVAEVSGHMEANVEPAASSAGAVFGIANRAVAEYVRLLVYPAGLTAEYPFPQISSLLDPSALASILLVAAIAAAIAWGYRRWKTASFGMLWLLLALVPVSNFVPLTPHFIAERYLYAPSVGFCIVAAALARGLYLKRLSPVPHAVQQRIVIAALSLCIVISVFITVDRNGDWESDITLWSKTVRQKPHSMIAYNNLGYAYQEAGMLENAVRAYRNAIAVKPGYVLSHYNIASIYVKREMYDEALERYREIVRLDSTFVRAYYGMGAIYAWKKMNDEAVGAFRTAIRLYPSYAKAHYRLGMIYVSQDLIETGIEHLEEACRLDPANARAHYELSRAYLGRGLGDEARREYRRAVEIDPRLSRRPYGFKEGSE